MCGLGCWPSCGSAHVRSERQHGLCLPPCPVLPGSARVVPPGSGQALGWLGMPEAWEGPTGRWPNRCLLALQLLWIPKERRERGRGERRREMETERERETEWEQRNIQRVNDFGFSSTISSIYQSLASGNPTNIKQIFYF